jgi:hypothetical protein
VIERRAEKIQVLEGELLAFRRPVKTTESSSVPPSRGQKANRMDASHRKPGPKRGHIGVSRVRSESDVVIECRPSRCGECHEPLTYAGTS